MFIKVTETETDRIRLIRVDDIEEVYEYCDEEKGIITKMLLRKKSEETDNFFEIVELLSDVESMIVKGATK